MCGISGFVAGSGNLIKSSIILNMTDLIHHRGPDDEGFIFLTQAHNIVTAGSENTPEEVWRSQTEYCPVKNLKNIDAIPATLAFGHKRLSIIDITPAGHQPMSYENGRYWIVFNGEIYNYLDLKNELEKAGCHFKTKNDTEAILAAYSEWGEECLNRFVGMWAFAIYDRVKNEIFLARDRYGIKPLYYYFSSNGDFYFASEIKQFTALKNWQSKMNSQRSYDQLVYSYTDHTDETMFTDVFQLPGGASFKSSIQVIKPDKAGRIQLNKWYSPKSDPFKGSFSEAAGIFRKLFETAVKEHLQADVPVGTSLSGGIDSSSIVCEVNRILMAEGTEALQKTFSSCSIDERYNEKKWMDLVINHSKVDAYFVFPRLEDVFVMTPDIIWHQDEPYQSQSVFLSYHVFNLAKKNGVKVLLNGQGADEYLGGYGQFTIARYSKMASQFRIQAMLNDIKNLQKINHVSSSTLLANILFHFLPSRVKTGITNIKSTSDSIKNIIDVKRLNLNPIHPYDNIPINLNTVSEISKHFTFFSALPKYLHWEDRNSMAHSVEARVPWLDHRLVEFANSLPDDFLEKDGVTKRVMREAMYGLLPEKIRNRKDKMGFTTAEELWVKRDNPALFRSKISDSIDIADGIIKPGALKYFDDVVDGKLPFDYTYWRLILFGEWIQKFHVHF